MKYGIVLTNLGEYADPRTVLRMARAAEASGWGGLFVWDHLGFVWGAPSGDPWVILSAVAAATTRLAIGTSVAPLPRYKPHVLAHALTTLDVLSGGRVVLGVGLGGASQEFTAFGESGDAKHRASMLDEALEVLTRLWSGEAVTHHGAFYNVEGVTLAPLPVQRPRIPIWVGAQREVALRRAARWDGWLPVSADETAATMTPAQLAERLAVIRQHRDDMADYDVAVTGYTQPGEAALVREYESAGATWWLESLHGMRGSLDDMLARLEAGPPGAAAL